MLEPLLFRKLETAAQLYSKKEYGRILKFYDKHVLVTQKSDVYRNILRMCCLIREDNSLWEGEYLASLESGEFDQFLSVSDKKYIQFYIYSQISSDFSEAKTYTHFEINDVSNRMKSFYPYNAQQSEKYSEIRSTLNIDI